eukprot:GDKK01030804.1.p1 GENE.GDKK01030804.1~~GDKK01030804.1.p1  ORF type:complete len:292 (-),score=62.40 GDKK01030804.1:144-1019(-)
MNDKGTKIMEDAEKDLKGFGWFGIGKEEKYEKAREKFLQAATFFKADGAFGKAAAAYERCAEMSEKCKSEIDYVEDTKNSALMLRKAKDPKATEVLMRVVEMKDKAGKYREAAKLLETAAEEPEMPAAESIELLTRAAKYYKSENSKASAAELNEKIAQMLCKGSKYGEARRAFEKLAMDALDDRLTRGLARKNFFMALLCELADIPAHSMDTSVEALRERFESYQDQDPQFDQHTREHMLMAGILDAMESQDIEAYQAAVDDYDNIIPLDDRKARMLLRGKHLLKTEDLT